MWCPACSWLIEEVLGKTAGVFEPRVSFLADLVQLKYDPRRISPREIMGRISTLGYRPASFDAAPGQSRAGKDMLTRLCVSAILSMNVMTLSWALYFGFFQDLPLRVVQYFSYPLWALATPAVFYPGWPIFRRGLAGLRHGSPSMDTLIAIGALSAYSYSVVQLFRGSLHLYFDTASMLISFVLLGKFLEARAQEKVAAGITGLYELAHQKVRRSNSGSAGAGERWVSPEALRPGDEFLVRAGERVPLDGRVVSGEADADESVLTGEARPSRKKAGGEVMAGALLLNGEVRVRTSRVGESSTLGQMISLIRQALAQKNPSELLADRITRWFVPAVLLASGLSFGVLLRVFDFSWQEAFLRSLTVLLISCPCALGIATPIVKLAVMGLARGKGILIRDPGALERARELDAIVFDKTGTLTGGNFTLQEIFAPGIPGSEALARVAALEARSDHYLAREIVRRAQEKSLPIEEADGFQALEGLGVKGRAGGEWVFAGNRRLASRANCAIPPEMEERAAGIEKKGMTVVFFGWAKEARGFLAFGDSLKAGVPGLMRKLREKGIVPWIVSGDGRGTTRAVAEECGVADYLGQALPADKANLVGSLQERGLRVGVVGDGINDSAALARADVGFALGSASNIHQEAADLVLPGSNPSRVLDALALSDTAVKAIRQNLAFAFFYNSAAIPFALSGLLNPLIAVLAMLASSLTVTANALRISRARPESAGIPRAAEAFPSPNLKLTEK